MLIISQQGMTTVSLVSDIREWYANNTILVDKNGISGTVTQVGIGVVNSSTILVDKNGLSGTTIDV